MLPQICIEPILLQNYVSRINGCDAIHSGKTTGTQVNVTASSKYD